MPNALPTSSIVTQASACVFTCGKIYKQLNLNSHWDLILQTIYLTKTIMLYRINGYNKFNALIVTLLIHFTVQNNNGD